MVGWTRWLLAIAAAGASALLLGGACKDSIGPNDYRPIAIAVGDTIVGEFHATDTIQVFNFRVPGGTYYAVFLQALSGMVGVRVGYVGFQVPLSTVLASPGPTLDQRATDAFRAHVQGEMEIQVFKPVAGTDARFRFLVQQINPAPEFRAPAFRLGDTVSGETLETIADLDDFTFPGQAGQVVIALLQAQGPSGLGTVRLEIHSPDGSPLPSTSSIGGDSVLADQVSGPFVLPVTATYDATVRSLRSSYRDYRGPYRFAVVPLQVGPELGPADIAIGDTVRDEINPIGDIDEFRFTGAAGQELNVFFQAMSVRLNDVVYLDMPLLGGNPASVQSAGTDTSLSEQATGRFTLPSPGPHLIRVHGADGGPGGDRSPYRVYLYPVDRRPEGAAANLVLGDSVTASIELPGDIDDYTLATGSTRLANVVLWRDAAGRGSFLLLGLDDHFRTCGGGLEVVPGQDAQGTGTFPLAAGSHRLSVCGADSYGFGYRGGYRVQTFAIDSLPESRTDTIAIGDTIGTEALEPPGDIDRFVFYGTRGRHIDVYFQGEAATSRGGFYLLVGPADSPVILAEVRTPALAPTLSGQRTQRIDLPTTGWYRIRVSPSQDGGDPRERGAYRFALVPFDASPETAARQVTLGDSVSSERIDYDDDMDEFVLTGTPGAEFAMYAQGGLRLVVYDTTTQDSLGLVASSGYVQSSGLLVLPPTGTVGLRVTGSVGPYWFKAVPINRAPETVPAAYTVGDTVRGEAISPGGDIDEFTSSATPGETLSPWYRLTATPVPPPGDGIKLEVIDPATGAVLVGQVLSLIGSTSQYFSPGPFVVPPAGVYRIRVHGGELETAPYEFFVKRGP